MRTSNLDDFLVPKHRNMKLLLLCLDFIYTKSSSLNIYFKFVLLFDKSNARRPIKLTITT